MMTTRITQNSRPGSVCFHTENAHASQSSENTIQDHTTDYSNRSRLGDKQEMQKRAGPVPIAELSSGIFVKYRNGVHTSLTPTSAHLLSLP